MWQITQQSVTYRYREFTGNFKFCLWYRKKLVPEKSLGTSIGQIWYRKKVSEPVLKKIGTEKSLGTGLEKIWYQKKSRNWSRKKLAPKKVMESVSKNFGTEKSFGIGLKKIWYRKQISEPVSKLFRILVLIWVLAET